MLRTHLILARISNLPTVWSNILCAWILARGFNAFDFSSASPFSLVALLVGASLLYTGGMYLNDYCDRDYDRELRSERPIPTGQISANTVLRFAIGYLATGFALLAYHSLLSAAFAALLVLAIVVYDLTHKRSPIAAIFMAACRALLYYVVAASFEYGIDFNINATAGALFLVIMGITFLARTEATTNTIDYPALVMLALPIVAAFYYRPEFFDAQRAAILALILGWTARSFLRARVDGKLIIGKTIGPLLAAIPLLDLLALSTLGLANQTHLILFATFFAIATAAQRVIPAT